MYEYEPWSKVNLNKMISCASNKLPILDIEFGGMCNMNCIYCDTPKYDFPCLLDLNAIEKMINSGDIKYVYVCGLGEPTVKGNVESFKQVLKMCYKNRIKVSIFSNNLNLDDELLQYIENGTLNVLFKLDSFKPDVIEYLYGTSKSNTILNNYNRLKEAVHIEGNTTNLGASIVISEMNYEEIFEIIDWCVDNKIYPFLGPLENAGKCSNVFDKLEISNNKLMRIMEYLKTKFEVDCFPKIMKYNF